VRALGGARHQAQLRVLVADDHDVHRALLRTIFECLGCSVTAVSDGLQALQAQGPFDVVCLDRHMPECGGVAVAKILRGHAFLIACTSDPSAGLEDFQVVIPKPISCAAITGAVAQARSWRAADRQRRWAGAA
jgi:CheY-like chemotaxis protein